MNPVRDTFAVPADAQPERLDTLLARLRPTCSRARWQELIRTGSVTVNGAVRKPNFTARAGDKVEYSIPPPTTTDVVPEDLPLQVLFEDEVLLVLDKAPGMVVHPAPGHDRGTLVHALLHHCPNLPGIGGEQRPGIVHRLDRDTSGIMVVAKTETALTNLAAQFKGREVSKTYLALVRGHPKPAAGTIDSLIGRSAADRKKMSTRPRSGGRRAVTHYKTLETFPGAALVELQIETGRTHQIRVHMASIGAPVLGDQQYGKGAVPGIEAPRQMLHAARLSFRHPVSGKPMEFTRPIPSDMQRVLSELNRTS